MDQPCSFSLEMRKSIWWKFTVSNVIFSEFSSPDDRKWGLNCDFEIRWNRAKTDKVKQIWKFRKHFENHFLNACRMFNSYPAERFDDDVWHTVVLERSLQMVTLSYLLLSLSHSSYQIWNNHKACIVKNIIFVFSGFFFSLRLIIQRIVFRS